MSRTRVLESSQYQWWHRVRRLRSAGFVVGLGGLAAPLLTAVFEVITVTVVRGGQVGDVEFALQIAAVLAPIYMGLFAWTWWYMEHRYRVTLAHRCPSCGYTTRATASSRCPECGLERQDSAAI